MRRVAQWPAPTTLAFALSVAVGCGVTPSRLGDGGGDAFRAGDDAAFDADASDEPVDAAIDALGDPIDAGSDAGRRFALDRRPVKVINLYGANYSDNPLGMNAQWSGGAETVDYLIGAIEAAYAKGFRRIILNRPGGDVPRANDFVSTSVWATLELEKRNALAERFAAYWATRSGECELGIYAGFSLPDHDDPANPCLGPVVEPADRAVCPVDVIPRLPNLDVAADARFVRENWSPWIEGIGVRHVAADNVSPLEKWSSVDAFAGAFAEGFWGDRSIKVTGEALPVVDATGELDLERARAMPWVSLWRFLRLRECTTGHAWSVDPTDVEIGVALTLDNAVRGGRAPDGSSCADPDVDGDGAVDEVLPTIDDVRALHARGFVLWSWGDDSIDTLILSATGE